MKITKVASFVLMVAGLIGGFMSPSAQAFVTADSPEYFSILDSRSSQQHLKLREVQNRIESPFFDEKGCNFSDLEKLIAIVENRNFRQFFKNKERVTAEMMLEKVGESLDPLVLKKGLLKLSDRKISRIIVAAFDLEYFNLVRFFYLVRPSVFELGFLGAKLEIVRLFVEDMNVGNVESMLLGDHFIKMERTSLRRKLNDGSTLFQTAIGAGERSSLKCLLAVGGVESVIGVDDYGRTLFHYAALQNNPAFTNLLRAALFMYYSESTDRYSLPQIWEKVSTFLEQRDQDGRRAVDYARDTGNLSVLGALTKMMNPLSGRSPN